MNNSVVSLADIRREKIVDALEAEGIREEITALFATGDHIDKQAWRDIIHDHLAEANAALDAISMIGYRRTDPTGQLIDTLGDWTDELEAEYDEWQRDRDADLAWAGKAWAE